MDLRGPRTRLTGLLSEAARLTDAHHRVDAGIEIRVARQDLANGREVLRGMPPLAPAGESIRIGGIWDTRTRSFVSKESPNPVVWYVGERQAEILIRGREDFDPDSPIPTRVLLLSAEGVGKSTLLAQWIVVQAVTLAEQGLSGYGGVTAPTRDRLDTMVKAIAGRIPIDSPLERRPHSWGTHYIHDREIRLKFGVTLQLRSTKKYSAATGSPVQGYTWRFS